jgi:hypothetical protein
MLTIITTDETLSDEVFVEALTLINSVVKQCDDRPSLKQLIVTSFEKQHKIHLPSKIVEKLWDFLTKEDMSDHRKWKENDKRLIVKTALMVIRNVLNIMPIQLEESYLTEMFNLLLDKTKTLYTLQHPHHIKTLHVFSGIMKNIFGIALTIASHVKRLPMESTTFSSLLFWLCEEKLMRKWETSALKSTTKILDLTTAS